MCHPTDSRPPAAPVRTGGVAEHGPLQLSTADGNRFLAYRAVPEVPLGRSIVLLPDIRGVHPFYEDLAQRFAEAGFRVLVIDYYGRTAGTAPRGDDFDPMQQIQLLDPAHVDADVAAAVQALRAESDDPVFTVGFCMGGAHSWRQAARGHGLAGAIGFYGALRFLGDVTEQLDAPLLMLLAGDDVVTTRQEFDELTAGFEKAGKAYEMTVYEGAPHSFFDHAFAEWADACTDAWHRVLDFTAEHA